MKRFWSLLFFGVISFNLFSQRACENFPALIAHGGGGYDGEYFMNCVEGLESSLQSGFAYVEFDLLVSSDGHIVATHDWEMFNESTGFPELGDSILTQAEFESRKIYSQYTPITYDTIIYYLEKYPDWVMVTDKLDDVLILDKFFSPYKDRIIVEAFSDKAFYDLIEKGYVAMLCVNETRLRSLLAFNVEAMIEGKAPVDFISFYYPVEYYEEVSRFQCLFPLNVTGYPLNDEEFISNHLGKEYVLIYTDFLKP